MELENISKEECIIKEAFTKWTDEISNEYIGNNELAMDVKMYMSLNKLYIKRKNQFSSFN